MVIPLHWLALALGLTNASGPWYLFWSGFFGDVTIFAAGAVFLRHRNCHVKGCWRIGLHPIGEYKVCRRHHPDPPTHQDIIDAHRQSLRDR